MSNYARLVVAKPLAEIQPALLASFETPSLLSVDAAGGSDFLISEAPFGTALDENGEMQFYIYVGHDPELLCKLSVLADTEVRAIAVQTGVVSVDLLVVNRGTIIRRYSECEGEVAIDEGQLPEWDDEIRKHAWNTADCLVGIFPPEAASKRSFFDRGLALFGHQSPTPQSQDPKTILMNSRRQAMDFRTPVAAISPSRFYDRKNREAAQMMVKPVRAMICGSVLECELPDQTSVRFGKHEVREVRQHPFDPNRLVVLLHDKRSVWLPPSVNKIDTFNEWLK